MDLCVSVWQEVRMWAWLPLWSPVADLLIKSGSKALASRVLVARPFYSIRRVLFTVEKPVRLCSHYSLVP